MSFEIEKAFTYRFDIRMGGTLNGHLLGQLSRDGVTSHREKHDDWLFHLSTAFGLSTSAGLNAYIPLLAISLLAKVDDLGGPTLINLSQPWDTLEHPVVIGVLVVLLLIETLADKVPAVNHVNDVVQTFVRPAAVILRGQPGPLGVHPVVP
jgi:hypothetical protein